MDRSNHLRRLAADYFSRIVREIVLANLFTDERQLIGFKTTCGRLSMNRSIDSLFTRRTPRKARLCDFKQIDLIRSCASNS